MPAFMTLPTIPTVGSLSLLRPYVTTYQKFRNINLIPIDYASRPHLRGRLTLP